MSPSESDAPPRSDGGDITGGEDLFTQRAADSVEESYTVLLRRWARSFIYAPIMAAWDDWRTRVGGLILLFYISLPTIGVWITPAPQPFRHGLNMAPFQPGWFTWTSVNVFGLSVPWFELSAALGSNATGQSMEALLIYGSVPIFKMIISGAVFAAFLGTFIGVFAGYKGGRIDGVLMTITDVVLTVPGTALIVVLAAVWRPENAWVVGIILGIDNWPGLARTVRSQVLSFREESVVEAHRALGLSTRTILRRDMISPLMPYISINFAGGARGIIFESVGLYFIGILPYTNENWGVILNSSYDNISVTNPNTFYYLFEPMLIISGLTFGLILFAQGLDQVFNVRLQARHEAQDQDKEQGAQAIDN